MTLTERINTKAAQMDRFICTCEAIAESHTIGDCTPMWHAMSWHSKTVTPVATIVEANTNFPRCCAHC